MDFTAIASKFIPKGVAEELYGFSTKIFVGLLVIIEIIVLANLKYFHSYDLVKLLNINLSWISVAFFLLMAFLVGHVLIILFFSFDILIFKLSEFIEGIKFIKKFNILKVISNTIHPGDPLLSKDSQFSELYKDKVLQVIGKHFNLPVLVGPEIYFLSKEYALTLNNYHKKHKINFEDNLTKGLFMNFLILMVYFTIQKDLSLSIICILLLICIGQHIGGFRDEVTKAIYNTTYIALLGNSEH